MRKYFDFDSASAESNSESPPASNQSTGATGSFVTLGTEADHHHFRGTNPFGDVTDRGDAQASNVDQPSQYSGQESVKPGVCNSSGSSQHLLSDLRVADTNTASITTASSLTNSTLDLQHNSILTPSRDFLKVVPMPCKINSSARQPQGFWQSSNSKFVSTSNRTALLPPISKDPNVKSFPCSDCKRVFLDAKLLE